MVGVLVGFALFCRLWLAVASCLLYALPGCFSCAAVCFALSFEPIWVGFYFRGLLVYLFCFCVALV